MIYYYENMKLIGTIEEKDIYPEREALPDTGDSSLRRAVRVILLDNEGKIAFGFYPEKEGFENEYNLPGGGVDDGETLEEGLIREALEETGCKVKNITELGMTNEYKPSKTKSGKWSMQNSYCFVAEVDGEKGAPVFSKREIGDGLELRWLTLDEAISYISKQRMSFMRVRSLMFLEEYKNTINLVL